MLRLWAAVPLIGTGTNDEPHQVDVSALGDEAAATVLASTDGVTSIVYILTYGTKGLNWVRNQVDVLYGEDVSDVRNRREHIPQEVRDAVQQRATELGLPPINMDYIDANPPGLVT